MHALQIVFILTSFFFGCCFETISEYCIDSNEKDVQTQSKIFHISFWNRLSNDSRNDQKIAFFVLLDYFSDDWPLSNTFLKNIQHEQTKKFGSKKKASLPIKSRKTNYIITTKSAFGIGTWLIAYAKTNAHTNTRPINLQYMRQTFAHFQFAKISVQYKC